MSACLSAHLSPELPTGTVRMAGPWWGSLGHNNGHTERPGPDGASGTCSVVKPMSWVKHCIFILTQPEPDVL